MRMKNCIVPPRLKFRIKIYFGNFVKHYFNYCSPYLYLYNIYIYMFHLAVSYSYCKYFMHSGISQLVPLLLIILSNDVSRYPGPPFHNSFFNFMSWNVNSIAKDDFQRVRLIEAHNSIFNYDLISVCETSLNHSIT